MKVFSKNDDKRSSVMTLGTFDGVHLGHQEIIKLTVQRAKQLNCKSALFTFDHHPLKVISPSRAPKIISSLNYKKKLIKELGIDQLIIESFTKDFAQIPYQDFVRDYLIGFFRVKEIIIGEDFRCGYKSEGTPENLEEISKEYGFRVQTIPAIKINGRKASSSSIRKLISLGKVNCVKDILGRNYIIDAMVVSGDKRGRELGFPTANLKVEDDYVIPPRGVYSCRVKVGNSLYGGVVNFGLLPTFNKSSFSIEVHIFNFSRDIYNRRIELELIERIRDEQKFNGKDQLVEQLKKDVLESKLILEREENKI